MENPVYKKLDGEETLNLLREISANPRITQRQMSSRLLENGALSLISPCFGNRLFPKIRALL